MNKNPLKIDPDIRRAETLSSDFYTDDAYFAQSREKIFARSWQLIGRTTEFDNLKPETILGGFLDQPILITKENEQIHCLSNVCTHRGNILIEKECRAKGIRCGYHGRRFSLDGKFLSMPEFEEVENFPSERDNLPKIPFGVWHEFIFASLNPAAPFEAFLSEIDRRISGFEFDNLRFTSARDYQINAHWALYCENYLEGFHIPFVHQSLNEEIDYGSYATETFRFASLQTALPGRSPQGRSPHVSKGAPTQATSPQDRTPHVSKGAPTQATSPHGRSPHVSKGAPTQDRTPHVSKGAPTQATSPHGRSPHVSKGASRDIPASQPIAAHYFFIFPNLMFNFYPWGLSVNIVKPLKKDLTKITFLTYLSDESKLEKGAGADLHRVEMEDERIVENVQKGIRSRFYDRGRYSPKREQGTHHFHRLIAEFMR